MRIFCEPCCGMASISFRLMQRHSKGPLSWMGGKPGTADVSLAVLGLTPGQGADAFVWGDVGPNVAALATLAGAMPPEDAAAWMLATRWSFSEKGPEHGYGGPGRPVNTVNANWTMENRDKALGIARMAGIIDEIPLSGARAVASVIRGWDAKPVEAPALMGSLWSLEGDPAPLTTGHKAEEPRALWDRLKVEGWPALMPTKEGRWLGPQSIEEVARWVHANALSMVKNGTANGYSRVNGEGNDFVDRHGAEGHWHATTPAVSAGRVEGLPQPPLLACWQGSVLDMPLPEDMSDWTILFDVPYKGKHGDNPPKGAKKISGYPYGDLSRADALMLCKRWDQRGAVVGICESVPLDTDLGGGQWRAVEVGHARVGNKRTFTKNQGTGEHPEEWITLNREPAYVPPKKQDGIF